MGDERVRLTIVNQYYIPDLAPTAQLTASLAEHRARAGDAVTVVASRGGYASDSTQRGPGERSDCRVLRIWTPRLGRSSVVRRCLDYAFFYLLAAWRLATLPRQDVILSLTTPPYLCWAAVLHKLLHRQTRVVLWNMDCYPEVAERTGVIRPEGLISRTMRAINRALFRRLDHVVCLDAAMASLLRSHYAPRGRYLPITVVPNWENASFATQPPATAPGSEEGTRELRRRFVVLYAGNMGRGHRFETVLEAAEALRDEPVTFLFNGGGNQAPVIEEAARRRRLENVVVQGYRPEEQLRGLMAAADCALITLRDEALGMMSPSKLHRYLAMRLPVIYVGPPGSNVDEAIGRFGCGVSLRHGDTAALVDTIRRLNADSERLAGLRRRAFRAFEEAYCDDRTLPQMDAVIDGRPEVVSTGFRPVHWKKAA